MYEDNDERIEYGTNYERALFEWGKFKSDQASLTKAIEIVKSVETLMGPIVLVYKVSSGAYVAVKYKNDPRAFVFIHPGFVDHRIQLKDSHEKLREEGEVWRTYLPGAQQQQGFKKKAATIAYGICDRCFLQFPLHQVRCKSCYPDD
jgi:hypothetical protein